MIIRKIQIDNYLCYYDTNTFELAEGLNIILGENGEGKTKFFEAIDWLFNGDRIELDKLVSAKKLDEIEIGETLKVKVSMTVEQYDDKYIITKSFIAKKENENVCTTSNFSIEGVEENSLGERNYVDGVNLLNRIFPFQIRKYSMFKGEAELNIFDNENALINLINLFSEAKHYDKYSKIGTYLLEKAEKAVEHSSKLDKKNMAQYQKLEDDIMNLQKQKDKYKILLNTTEDEIKRLEENLQDAERHVNNADALEIINNRIKKIEDKILKVKLQIKENYTTFLFDENWILVNFEPFHKEFVSKVSRHSILRREQQAEFYKQIGIREGERKAKQELLNNALPLPMNVPSKSHIEEMLHDEICKVCNREAPKGSPAYNFMMDRLRNYIESQKIEENVTQDDEKLFKYDYTNRLNNMSVSHEDNLKNLRLIKDKVKDLFSFNNERKKDLNQLLENLEKEKSEREQILGNSSVAEDKLIDVLKNYNAWQRDISSQNKFQLEYSKKLSDIDKALNSKKEEKDNIDTNSASSFLIKTRNILRDIEKIFNETKEEKFDEFINKLQNKSNSIFKKINVDAFTGTIVFSKRHNSSAPKIIVELQEDGRTFYKPNQSLLTSMHISILFAISELAAEIKEENFPIIFDAPTSSFGENKTAQFLNLLSETDGQKILLIKDFLYTEKTSKSLSIKKEFENIKREKAFWVKLERPFDPNNLKTINTQIITL